MVVCPPELNATLHRITSIWQRGGGYGVDLFFVLSGFLISGLLFKEHQRYGSLSLRNFFVRRGLKIYPPFFALILITVVRDVARGERISPRALAREMLFVQNYGDGGLWHHTWSLAVEEHFYILLPLMLVLALSIQRTQRIKSAPFRWIPLAFAVTALVCLLLRLKAATVTPYDNLRHHFPTHLRLDSLFAGVVVSYFYHCFPLEFKNTARRYALPAVFVGALCFVPGFLFDIRTTPFIYTYGNILFWLGSGLILFGCVGHEPRPGAFTNASAFVGSRSYCIYLWHMAIPTWATTFMASVLQMTFGWYLYVVIYMLGAVLLGILMSYVTEHPALLLRDRLCPSRSQSLETTTPNPNAA